MLDLFSLPFPAKADVQAFYGGSVADWRTWIKPRGKTMAYMLCLSGGGGGGGGTSSAAGSGGTGGGSSAQSSLLIPCLWLPDTLFIQTGTGGVGGAGVLNAVGGNGSVGTTSYISVDQTTTVNNLLLTATPGTIGAGGTIAAGTAGTAAAVNTVAQCPLSGLGKALFLAGQAGSVANDVNNTGTAQTYATTGLMVQGGSGGGAPTGGTATGVAITAAGIFPGVAASAGVGANGFVLSPPSFPLRLTGGAGGGGGATSFMGGNGSYGCGGGGGGGVPAAATSKPGGNGGGGLVIIACW